MSTHFKMKKNLAQLQALKWRSAVKSLQWILGSFSASTKYQTYVFNDHAQPLKEDTKDTRLEARNQPELETIASNIETIVPFENKFTRSGYIAAKFGSNRIPFG